MSTKLSMYIDYEKRRAEVERLTKLDLVSRLEVEAAVASYAKVQARVEAVATVIANLRDQFRGVEKYNWTMHDWRIQLQEPAPGMEHLRNSAVRVRLTATLQGNKHEDGLTYIGRGGHMDDATSIVRFVEFPISYLTSENWLEEDTRAAKLNELWHLQQDISGMPELIQKRKTEVDDLNAKYAAMQTRVQELRDEGIELPNETAEEEKSDA